MLSRLSRSKWPPVADISLEELHANPYPVYRRLRAQSPVAYAPNVNYYWLVTRWDDVVSVLKDDETFSARTEPGNFPDTLRGSLLYLDGEQHARHRSTMQPPCQPRAVAEFASSAVPDLADGLLDAFEGKGEAELVRSFFEPLAVAVLPSLVGLEEVSREDVRTWVRHASNYFIGEPPPPEAEASNLKMAEAIRRNLRRVREEPDASLLSAVVNWRDDAGSLSEHQFVANTKVFLAAGVHELHDLTSHTLLGLLSRPEQLAEVRTDPSVAKTAIEEGARWASPVGIVPRVTSVEVELSGVRIPQHALVCAVLASANRDEKRWSDGSRFDLHRDEGMHLAFASGVHFCLGAWLARAVGTIALQRLIERLPGLRLKPGDPLVVSGWRFREVRRLPVAWS